MDEYIERQAAIEAFENGEADVIENYGDGCDFGFGIKNIKDVLNAIPATDVAPVRHGRWIDRYGGRYENALHECSECRTCALYKSERDVLGSVRLVQELSEYCPHCGARMDGGADNG